MMLICILLHLFSLVILKASYDGTSGALLSMVNILGSDLYLNATFANSAAAVIDVFLHYDVKLIIKDGILSLNV